MKTRFCLFLSLCWALFVACQTTPTPTPAPAEQPQPTVELIPSATYTAVSPTATATAWPTATVAPPTPTPPPAEPTWHQPDPAAYLPVFSQLYGVESPESHPSVDKQPFERFLQRDKELYFADGWPAAITFFTTPPAEKFWMSTRDNLLTQIVIQGFMEYLNDEKIDLTQQKSLQTEASQVTLIPADLKGDGSSQWVVQLKNDYTATYNPGSLFLFVYQDAEGIYHLNPELLYPLGGLSPEEYEFYMVDVTGTPADDLVFYSEVYGGGAFNSYLHVFSWQNNQLEPIHYVDLTWGRFLEVTTEQATYDLTKDVTGDGRVDIKVNYPQPGNFGCEGTKTEIYSWDLTTNTYILEEIPPAETADCYLWQGILEQNSTLLEKSLAQREATDPASADLKAINILHLGLAYYGQGEDELAQTTLAQLNELPEGVIANLAKTAYQTAAHPLELCRLLIQQAPEAMNSDIAPYMAQDMVYRAPFESSEHLFQPYLCPAQPALYARLEARPLIAPDNPLPQLEALQTRLLDAEEVQLNDTPALEWVIFLEDFPTFYLVLESITTTWHINYKFVRYNGFESFDIYQKDVSGDGVEDIFGVLTAKYCEYPNETMGPHYDTTMFYISEDKRYGGNDVPHCSAQEGVTSDEPTPDQFHKQQEPVEWQQVGEIAEKYQLEAADDSPLLLSELMHSLTNLALKGELPAGVIDDTLAQLPTDNPETEPYRAQLLFMQGYQHEQAGETDQALSYYLTLINSYPTSVWSLLAQTRVQLP